MTAIDKAWLFATEAHKGQKYGNYPYVYHLKKVYEVAINDLELDSTKDKHISILVGCILHDVLEDTNISYSDIKKEFGITIADIVYDVTDELGKTRNERKIKTYPKIKKNELALVVKLCDRIANIRECMENNMSLLEMYVKEHEEFKKELFTGEDWSCLNNCWYILEDLIKNIKRI